MNKEDVKKILDNFLDFYDVHSLYSEITTEEERVAQQICDLDKPQTSTDLIEDGFGSAASAICPTCGLRAVYVCRPGDIRCGVCYDNNPKEWYTGSLCPECGMKAIHNGECLACKPVSQPASEGLCSCGNPQSHPIPHEHDLSAREKEIIAHYEARIKELEATNQDLKVMLASDKIRVGEYWEGKLVQAKSEAFKEVGEDVIEIILNFYLRQEFPVLSQK